MRNDATRWCRRPRLRYLFGKSFRDCSKASPRQRCGQRRGIQIIKAVYASCVNDDISVNMAKNEPRIALIRNPTFGFNGKAGLEKRMLNTIKLRKLLICPPARRRRWPLQPEYVTAHDKSTSPVPTASR